MNDNGDKRQDDGRQDGGRPGDDARQQQDDGRQDGGRQGDDARQQQDDGRQGDRRKIADNVDEIVDEVSKTVRVAIGKGVDAAESIGENLRDTIEGVRNNRGNVMSVRVDGETLARLDELVEAGIMSSRSEAAAFLIGEGVKARQGLFDRIAEKIQEIRRAKEELRRLVDDDKGA